MRKLVPAVSAGVLALFAGSLMACPYGDKAEMADNESSAVESELFAQQDAKPAWLRALEMERDADKGQTVTVPN